VVDNLPPVAVAKQNIVLVLENGIATLTAEDVDNGSYDGCTDVEVSISQTEFTIADVGTVQVWLTVTDLNGNYNQTWSYVTVTNGVGCDLTNIIFPNDIDVFDDNATTNNLSIDNLQALYGYTYEEVHPYTVSDCPAIYYAFSDQIIVVDFGYKVLRDWTAIDWITGDVVTQVQLIKLYTNYPNSLACNDQESISIENGPVTLLPIDVLEGGPYDYNNMTLVIVDSDNIIVEDNVITADYLGETLLYTVSDNTTGNSCWGNLIVEKTQYSI